MRNEILRRRVASLRVRQVDESLAVQPVQAAE